MSLVQTFDKDEVPEEDEDEQFTTLPFGDKVVRINTSVNEEKLNAFNMLCCYVMELKEAFFPYCAEVGAPILHAYVHTYIRATNPVRIHCADFTRIHSLELA